MASKVDIAAKRPSFPADALGAKTAVISTSPPDTGVGFGGGKWSLGHKQANGPEDPAEPGFLTLDVGGQPARPNALELTAPSRSRPKRRPSTDSLGSTTPASMRQRGRSGWRGRRPRDRSSTSSGSGRHALRFVLLRNPCGRSTMPRGQRSRRTTRRARTSRRGERPPQSRANRLCWRPPVPKSLISRGFSCFGRLRCTSVDRPCHPCGR